MALLVAPIHFQRSDAVPLRFERHGSVAQAMSLQISTRLIAVLDIRDVEKRYSVPGNGTFKNGRFLQFGSLIVYMDGPNQRRCAGFIRQYPCELPSGGGDSRTSLLRWRPGGQKPLVHPPLICPQDSQFDGNCPSYGSG